jgi:hypothetical protein
VEIDIINEWGKLLARQKIAAPRLTTVVLTDSLLEAVAKDTSRLQQQLVVYLLHQTGDDSHQYRYDSRYPAVNSDEVTLQRVKNPFPLANYFPVPAK